MRRRVFLPIVATTVLVVGLLWMWYNSGQHKLERCVKAQQDHFYSTRRDRNCTGTERIRRLTCSSSNATNWVSTDGTSPEPVNGLSDFSARLPYA